MRTRTIESLSLGDTLEDGAKVIGRQGSALIVARRVPTGWVRETRVPFSWPDGRYRELSLVGAGRICQACGEASLEPAHPGCEEPQLNSMEALEEIARLGGRMSVPCASGDYGPWSPSLDKMVFTYFDFETTGLDSTRDRVIEIGAIRFSVEGEISRFESLVSPGDVSVSARTTAITGLTQDSLEGAPPACEAFWHFLQFVEGSAVVAHNLEFDWGFLVANAKRHSLPLDGVLGRLCTLRLARGGEGKPPLVSRSETANYKLDTLASTFGFTHTRAHRALSDVEAGVQLLDLLLRRKFHLTVGD